MREALPRGVLSQSPRFHFLVRCEPLPRFCQARLRRSYPPFRLQAEMPRLVKTRPVRCAPSSLVPGTLLSEPSQFKISSKATLGFPSPAGPPGFVFSLSAQTYAAHTLTSSRVRDLPKSSPT